jgi:hypothetical protein
MSTHTGVGVAQFVGALGPVIVSCDGRPSAVPPWTQALVFVL